MLIRPFILSFFSLMIWTTGAAGQQKPPPPSDAIPALLVSGATTACVGCDNPFDTDTHTQLLEGLVANPYVSELRKALYTQDIGHQFQSKAHFDNCHFAGSFSYLNELAKEVDEHAASARAAKDANDTAATSASARKAFFALGQILHGTQDFYAHSNYVELNTPKVTKATDIPVFAPWREGDQDKISDMQARGLVSGFVFWGYPQDCTAGARSHHDLAKDSADTKSGKLLNPHLENLSNYRIAILLARQASLQLMQDAFQRWPILREINGPNVAFEVILDRRGL